MKKRILLICVVFVVFFAVSLMAEENKQVVNDNEQPAINNTASEREPTPPQKPKASKPRLTLKPAVGVFWPKSNFLQEKFGKSWLSYGLSIGFADADKSNPGFNFKAEVLARRSGDAHIYMIPIGVSYTIRPKNDGKLVPYFGGAAQLCIAKIKDNQNDLDTGFQAKPMGTIFAGVNIGKHVNIEADYYAISKVENIDLSGLGITLMYVF